VVARNDYVGPNFATVGGVIGGNLKNGPEKKEKNWGYLYPDFEKLEKKRQEERGFY